MEKLERAKFEVQLMKLQAAKKDMEIRIMEYENEMKRINENIKIQDNAISELKIKMES